VGREFKVTLEDQFGSEVERWSTQDQVVIYGGLILPLRRAGFEVIQAAQQMPTSVLSVDYIEPANDMNGRWAKVYMTLPTIGVLALRVNAFASSNLLVEKA